MDYKDIEKLVESFLKEFQHGDQNPIIGDDSEGVDEDGFDDEFHAQVEQTINQFMNKKINEQLIRKFYVALKHLDISFHPDDDFEDYVNDDGAATFTDDEAAKLNKINNDINSYCESNEVDQFQIGTEIFHSDMESEDSMMDDQMNEDALPMDTNSMPNIGGALNDNAGFIQELEEYDDFDEGPQPGDMEYHNAQDKMGDFNPHNESQVQEMFELLTQGLPDIYEVYPREFVKKLENNMLIHEEPNTYDWVFTDEGKERIRRWQDLEDFLLDLDF